MDEAQFRQRLQSLGQNHCPFHKAILSACVACTRADRIQIAEREVVVCTLPTSHARCTDLYEQLRHNFSFSLGVTQDGTILPHAQQMHIQCGGLRGLAATLTGNAAVNDVDGLLEQTVQYQSSTGPLDFSAIVHAAREHYQGRRNS